MHPSSPTQNDHTLYWFRKQISQRISALLLRGRLRAAAALSPCRASVPRSRISMLNKVLNIISGQRHQDSRSSSPARSPKGLQTAISAPAVVHGTDSNNHAQPQQQPQQQQDGSQTALPPSNGASARPTDQEVPCHTQQQQQEQVQEQEQQQLPAPTASHNGTSGSAACTNGVKATPAVPPLAPGTVVRTSSAGSAGSSRRASLLSDAGRASSRSSLQEQQQPQEPQEQEPESSSQLDQQPRHQQQQQQPSSARPAVSQLPLHLVPGCKSEAPSVPPSVATSQGSSPERPQQPQPQQQQPQQQQQQPFWHGSNWSFGSHCEQNRRRHMEDRFAATNLTGNSVFGAANRAGFFAVYDGHSGHEAAEYLEANLQAYVLAAGPEALATRPLQVLSDAVQQAEREIVATFLEGHGSELAGSTLCAVLLVDDKLHVAHVGDSRAVLGRGTEPIQLTRDHKPQCRIEAARIEADDPKAEISGDGYMYGELAVARAIGSAAWKRDPSKRALIPTPDLVSIQLQPEDDFVLLATDGLWDKVDNGEAVSVARRSLCKERSADSAARALIERAQRKDSTDNITVVTLLLHGRTIAMPKSNSMLFRRSALPSSLAAAAAGADSPPGGCSTPCSGGSTPVSGATPRCCTPNRGPPLTSTASAPAVTVAAAADDVATATTTPSPSRALSQQLPPQPPQPQPPLQHQQQQLV